MRFFSSRRARLNGRPDDRSQQHHSLEHPIFAHVCVPYLVSHHIPFYPLLRAVSPHGGLDVLRPTSGKIKDSLAAEKIGRIRSGPLCCRVARAHRLSLLTLLHQPEFACPKQVLKTRYCLAKSGGARCAPARQTERSSIRCSTFRDRKHEQKVVNTSTVQKHERVPGICHSQHKRSGESHKKNATHLTTPRVSIGYCYLPGTESRGRPLGACHHRLSATRRASTPYPTAPYRSQTCSAWVTGGRGKGARTKCRSE